MTGRDLHPADAAEVGLDVADLLCVVEMVINCEALVLTSKSRDALGTVLRVARGKLAAVVTVAAPVEGAER